MHHNTSAIYAGAAFLTICALAPAGCERELPQEQLGQSSRALCVEPPVSFDDPITREDYPMVYHDTLSIGAGSFTTATASLPGDVAGVAQGRFPLVLIIHGNGFGYMDYTPLQDHLAKNGFVTVSAEWDSNTLNLDGVKQALQDLLIHLHLDWQHNDSLSGHVALVGHSRGGELAAKIAPEVANLWALDALVLMAPAPNAELRDVYVGYHSADMLVLFGANDDDTAANGSNKAAAPPDAHKNAFYYHDLYGPHGNEHTSLCNAPTYEKAMIYVKGVSHAAWQSDPSELPSFSTPCTGGQLERCEDMTKGFVSGFLHWQFDNDDQYVPMFQGKSRPASLDPALEYQTQFSGRWRAVVDAFTLPGVSNNDAGGGVTWTNVAVEEDTASLLHASSTHASKALSITWPTCAGQGCDTPAVEFTIPAAAAARDAAVATHLSIRAGTLDANDVPDFHVQLISGDDVASPLVPLSTYGGVAEKYPFAVPTLPSRYSMSTTLIPMCAFENVDLGDVARVRLVFDAPNHEAGDIMIDNVEFLYEQGDCG